MIYRSFLKKTIGFLSFRPEYFLMGLLLLFIPGQNYYQILEIKAKEKLFQEINFNLPEPAFYPLKISSSLPPVLTARSFVIFDASGVSILNRNPDGKLPPASTTKIMTALIALENYKLNDVLPVNRLFSEGAQMGLKIGEKVTVENLLYGLLLNSGNDAAYVLADNFPNGFEQFIYSMNKKAEELNMKNTHFSGVTGLEKDNHFTTSKDLARLTAFAVSNPSFLKIVSTKKAVVSDIFQKRWYPLENLNKLLGSVPGVLGVKTGFTEDAGECLVSFVERDGKRLIIVILRSQDRFGETEKLINWVFENYRWVPVILSTRK